MQCRATIRRGSETIEQVWQMPMFEASNLVFGSIQAVAIMGKTEELALFSRDHESGLLFVQPPVGKLRL
jgi:hypothetical protein